MHNISSLIHDNKIDKVIRILEDDPSLIHQPIGCWSSPLAVACNQTQWYRGTVDLVQWLLDHGADVNDKKTRDSSPQINMTPLIAALGNPALVQQLLDLGAEVNYVATIGSALSYACECGYPKAVAILLAAGADIGATTLQARSMDLSGIQQVQRTIIFCSLNNLHNRADNKECIELMLEAVWKKFEADKDAGFLLNQIVALETLPSPLPSNARRILEMNNGQRYWEKPQTGKYPIFILRQLLIFREIPIELLEYMAKTSGTSLPDMFDSLPTELQNHRYLIPHKQAFIHTEAAKNGTITDLKDKAKQRQLKIELE